VSDDPHPLQCRCGTVRGVVSHRRRAVRAVCYCRDCQTFARWLGHPELTLDRDGGSDVIATAPGEVRFTDGLDSIACMSLSPRGLLRWYASCCRTPLGNTPRQRTTSYVGLLHDALAVDGASLDDTFGPILVRVQTDSAWNPVQRPSPWTALRSITGVVASILGARITGRYRHTPFFEADGKPIRTPLVIEPTERARLRDGEPA
jgi:hypothetical protein